MIKVLLLTCLAGLAAAQYGHGDRSGYGPDGVRNRYFILGHGRGPISTSIGSGIYGTSLGGHGNYRPSHSGGSGYRQASSSGHGGYGLGGGHRGYGGHGLSGGSGNVGAAYGGAGYGAVSYGGAGYGGPSHGGSSYGGPSHGGSSYGGLEAGSGHGSYAPARSIPSYGSSHGSGSRGYGSGSSSYASTAPAVRSYSGPSVGHGLYGPSANHGYSAPAPSSYGGHHDDYAQPTPYEFGYDVHNEHGDQQNRQESGDGHGNVKGSYGYRDSYGIFRHVDYVADHHGFRANVRTNEPGTAPQDPADVKMNVEHGGYGGGHGGGYGGY